MAEPEVVKSRHVAKEQRKVSRQAVPVQAEDFKLSEGGQAGRYLLVVLQTPDGEFQEGWDGYRGRMKAVH